MNVRLLYNINVAVKLSPVIFDGLPIINDEFKSLPPMLNAPLFLITTVSNLSVVFAVSIVVIFSEVV